MPAAKRSKTKYPGVFFIIGQTPNGKPEKIYYIRYRRNGKATEEKAGRQYQDDMTPAKAAGIRGERIQGKDLSNTEQRAKERAQKAAKQGRYTIDRLWREYSFNRKASKGLSTDSQRYEKYIKPSFGDKEPNEIIKLDVDRLRIALMKKLAPQTVKHVLNLLTWIINYGTKNGLCRGVAFHIQKPTVNNIKTEDLTPEQIDRLLQAIEADPNTIVGAMMKMALYSGMRRGELFKLQWADVNFDTGFIFIRDPKGGVDQKIPINDMARALLESIPRTSQYVFPGKDGGLRVSTGTTARRIREAAGLPKNFRPLHGLRHVFASMLASSGKVDMYVLQKLLTHKNATMTQRYAHLRDQVLKDGAGQVDAIFKKQAESKKEAANG